MNTYIMHLDRNLKTIQKYLHNAHRQNLKSMYHCNKNLYHCNTCKNFVIPYINHD